jgi:hypothetical protein
MPCNQEKLTPRREKAVETQYRLIKFVGIPDFRGNLESDLINLEY